MYRRTPLINNIVLTFIVLYCIQAILFIVPALIYSFPSFIIVAFFCASALFHGIFTVLLILMKHAFVNEATGEILTSVNMANLITLSRLSAIPTIVFLFFEFRQPGVQCIIFFFIAFVFITDFVDGVIARYCRQITTIGRYLDSSSDYFLIIFTSIIYFLFGLVPIWLFILIVVRLLILGAGAILYAIIAKKVAYSVTFLGKASIFSIMTLFVLKLVPFIVSWAPFSIILSVIEYCVAAFLVASFIEKIVIIVREKKKVI
ncbi:MAG: CDP-alcohol phosphatidyltransferase family protein [Spirochaetales bacterium]|nr:CDP-alcohol phosphatidyltransferase family protein [Spirochaetales bacterium]